VAQRAIVADEHELAAVRGRLLGLVEAERIVRIGIPRPDPRSVVPIYDPEQTESPGRGFPKSNSSYRPKPGTSSP
jgi:hypothetical protein